MPIIKRIIGLLFQFGGVEHTGWLPHGAAIPLPTPIENVVLDLKIESDGYGYLLLYVSRDGKHFADTWHESLEDALLAAKEQFGIEPSDWVTGDT